MWGILNMKKKAFTLLEMLAALVVLGVVVSVAIPSVQWQIQKVKNQEAEPLLMAVYGAQLDFFSDNGYYTNDIGNLGIEIDQSKLRNFEYIVPANLENITCTSSTVFALGKAATKATATFQYDLYVLTDGRIVCSSSSDLCNATVCLRMGYEKF